MKPPRGFRPPLPEGLFVIDGYNLLHRGLHRGEGNLEAARETLEVRIREFRRAAPEARIILIYDGARGIESPLDTSPSDPDFRILFSVPPMTADEAVLEESRRRAGEGGPIFVVSSDEKDIGRQARRLGFRHMTSEEFAEVLDDAMERPRPAPGNDPPRRAPEKPEPEEIPKDEVAEWLRIFSAPKPPRGPGKRKPG